MGDEARIATRSTIQEEALTISEHAAKDTCYGNDRLQHFDQVSTTVDRCVIVPRANLPFKNVYYNG